MSNLNSDSPLPDDEPIGRFLTSRSHYNQMGVKGAAFLPPRQKAETSVVRHSGTPQQEVLDLAQVYFQESDNPPTVYGLAQFEAQDVRQCQLEVEISEPPPLHANIIGWPVHPDPDEQQAMRKDLAAHLAEKTRAPLLLFQPPVKITPTPEKPDGS